MFSMFSTSKRCFNSVQQFIGFLYAPEYLPAVLGFANFPDTNNEFQQNRQQEERCRRSDMVGSLCVDLRDLDSGCAPQVISG